MATRSQLKHNFFRLLSARVKFVKFLISILKWHVSSSSVFVSFFIVMKHNSSVNFKVIQFLLRQKDPIKVPILTFSTALVKICQIPHVIFQATSRFFQILHHSPMSWKITPLYFFSSSTVYFAQKEHIKVNIFGTFGCSRSKFAKLLTSILKQQVNSSPDFVSLFSFIKDNSSVHF